MSKLEDQKALPRRKLYRTAEQMVDAINAAMERVSKRTTVMKRKAKPVTDAQLKWTKDDADRTLESVARLNLLSVPRIDLPPDRTAQSAEISKFMTQSAALRRGRKLAKRKAKKAKRK